MMNLNTLVDPDATPAHPVVRSVGQADLKDALAGKASTIFCPCSICGLSRYSSFRSALY